MNPHRLFIGGNRDGEWHDTQDLPVYRLPILRSAMEAILRPSRYLGVEQPVKVDTSEYFEDYKRFNYGRKDRGDIIVYLPQRLLWDGKPRYDLIEMLMAGYRKPKKARKRD